MSREPRITDPIIPDPENLPPDSILRNVRMSGAMRPPKHLMHLFDGYLKNEEMNPNYSEIDFHDFGKNWLPLFNYGAHEDHANIPIMDWVEQVSKNPYRSVRLMQWVDGVYTCIALIPPIFDAHAKIIKDDERDYFPQLATRQAHLVQSAHRVKQANGFIERNLTSRIEGDELRQRVLSNHFHRMNEIFKLYGVEREIPEWLKNSSNGELSPVVKDEVEERKATQDYSSGMIEEDE